MRKTSLEVPSPAAYRLAVMEAKELMHDEFKRNGFNQVKAKLLHNVVRAYLDHPETDTFTVRKKHYTGGPLGRTMLRQTITREIALEGDTRPIGLRLETVATHERGFIMFERQPRNVRDYAYVQTPARNPEPIADDPVWVDQSPMWELLRLPDEPRVILPNPYSTRP